MIKLTEVVASATQYNPEERKMDSKYRLRNFYVNPKFIISMSDNEKLNEIHERQPIIDELISGARFTKLIIASKHYPLKLKPRLKKLTAIIWLNNFIFVWLI